LASKGVCVTGKKTNTLLDTQPGSGGKKGVKNIWWGVLGSERAGGAKTLIKWKELREGNDKAPTE